MSLTNEERDIVVGLEKDKAISILQEIEILRAANLWNTVCNRLYYAAFHAVSALLIHDGHPVQTHQGAVVLLHQYYVKTGRLSREEGAFYSQLQSLREESDYNCTYYANEQDTLPRIEPTHKFVEKIFSLIEQ